MTPQLGDEKPRKDGRSQYAEGVYVLPLFGGALVDSDPIVGVGGDAVLVGG